MSESDESESADECPPPATSSSTVGRHIFFANDDDDDDEDKADVSTQKVIERPVSSTIRVDTSDLISRCKDFIPMLSDEQAAAVNRESVIETDEFDLPDLNEADSSSENAGKESGEASSSSEEEVVQKKRKKKKKKKKKKPKTDNPDHEDVAVPKPADVPSPE